MSDILKCDGGSFEHRAPMGTGHGTCNGNIVADNLARMGANLREEHIDCGLPLSACKTELSHS